MNDHATREFLTLENDRSVPATTDELREPTFRVCSEVPSLLPETAGGEKAVITVAVSTAGEDAAVSAASEDAAATAETQLTHTEMKEVFRKALAGLIASDPILSDLHPDMTHQEVRAIMGLIAMVNKGEVSAVKHPNVSEATLSLYVIMGLMTQRPDKES